MKCRKMKLSVQFSEIISIYRKDFTCDVMVYPLLSNVFAFWGLCKITIGRIFVVGGAENKALEGIYSLGTIFMPAGRGLCKAAVKFSAFKRLGGGKGYDLC